MAETKNVTRVDLCAAVHQEVGLSCADSSAFVELVLKEITDCLERGETVKLSSFGSFTIRKKKQRLGRNPKTGVAAQISARRTVVFKPSAILKQRINRKTTGSDALAHREPHSSAAG
jgi:integration host factor subunit alpha